MVPGVTEIVGTSAAGKTQICMQLSLAVQLPPEQGGLDGGALRGKKGGRKRRGREGGRGGGGRCVDQQGGRRSMVVERVVVQSVFT